MASGSPIVKRIGLRVAGPGSSFGPAGRRLITPSRCVNVGVTVHGLPAEYPAVLAQCRLSLRESSAAFAERKATLATRERLRPNNHVRFREL